MPATEVATKIDQVRHAPCGEPLSLLTGGKQMNQLKRFLTDERGAELAEYAVGTAILVAVAIIVYKVLGDAVNIKMSTVANEVQK
jgi:Flp pilus assembly pilin Flp